MNSCVNGRDTTAALTNDLRCLKLPWRPRHSIHGVCASNTDGEHAEPSGIGCVRVGTQPDKR